MENELNIDGLGISTSVIETIIAHAIDEVEGVAGVGGGNAISGLKARFGSDKPNNSGIEVSLSDDGKFNIGIRLQAVYGNKLGELADAVRSAVNDAIMSQVGIGVNAVDIFVDGVVFPEN